MWGPSSSMSVTSPPSGRISRSASRAWSTSPSKLIVGGRGWRKGVGPKGADSVSLGEDGGQGDLERLQPLVDLVLGVLMVLLGRDRVDRVAVPARGVAL